MLIRNVKVLVVILVICLARYSCEPRMSDDWQPPALDDALLVLQRNARDCGIAAAATFLRLVGEDVDYQQVASYVRPGVTGIDMHSLARVIARHGVAMAGYRFDGLGSSARLHTDPWIGLLGAARLGHYVVVSAITRDTVTVYDPQVGRRLMRRKRFESSWSGIALVRTTAIVD